jgi:hypothetical protein
LNDYPLLDLFWTMLMFFLWIAWIFLLFRIITDVFRSQMSGVAKALWTLFVVFLPFLGTLAYLIARGTDMQTREMDAAAAKESAIRAYIRESAAPTTSPADELTKLAALRDQGVLTVEEFDTQKALILSK